MFTDNLTTLTASVDYGLFTDNQIQRPAAAKNAFETKSIPMAIGCVSAVQQHSSTILII
jgi:hypothetical protein